MDICVFCASSDDIAQEYFEVAKALGQEIGKRGHNLVYGGSDSGLMGTVARAVRQSGGAIIGVVPRRIAENYVTYDDADEFILTETMAERKAVMEERADAFVVMPGGFGTLEELFEVLTLKQLRYIDSAIVLLNTNEFYHPLLNMFDHLFDTGFAYPIYRQLYVTQDTPLEAIDYIETYTPPQIPAKWEGSR